MAILTPAYVYRKYVVDGVPSSGDNDPVKAEIVQLLNQLFGVANGSWVVTQTKAGLDSITPGAETWGGAVLNDPNPANNGYYYRSSGDWMRGRGFPESAAVLTNVGGTPNAITATATSAVDPANIVMVFLPSPLGDNTSPDVTLRINGGTVVPVKSATGGNLGLGDIRGGVGTFFFRVGNEWRQPFPSASEVAFDHQGLWQAPITYTQGQVVTASDNKWYQLKVPTSTGDDPVSSPAEWLKIWDGDSIADGSRGDVTVSGAGSIWTISPDAPTIVALFEQTSFFYSTLALETADRSGPAILAGTEGNGIFDGFNFLTYVDTAGATGLDTSTAGELDPSTSAPTTIGNTATPAAGPVNFGGVTVVDRTYSLTNSQTVARIKLFSSAPVSCALKIVRRNSPGSYDVVYNQAFSHPGGGWATMSLSSPFAVPASGAYHVALFYSASQTIETFTSSGARGAYTGNAAGNGVPFTESTGAIFATNANMVATINNLMVASTGFTMPAAPEWGRLIAFVMVNDAVVGADLLFDVSRDSGANWQMALAMTQSHLRADGSAVLDSGTISLSSASGTVGKWRARTLNGKFPRLLAIGIQMGVN